MSSAENGPRYPAPGVTVANPAMAPLATPRTVGLPRCTHSAAIQLRAPAAAAVCVAKNATVAVALAPSPLPALNPNQPNHSSPVPSNAIGRLCGAMLTDPYPPRPPPTNPP